MKENEEEFKNLLELRHILYFILENKNIAIGEHEIITRDTLITISSCCKFKTPNNFQLTKDQTDLLINTFIMSDKPFNNFTPSIITNNKECIKLSLERSLDSINYITFQNEETKSFAIEEVIRKGFILKKDSADYLKENYQIALNSIKQDPQSANYIHYSKFNSEELNNLVDTAIEYGYTLDENTKSTHCLEKVPEIVLSSIKKDLNNLKYASKDIIEEPSVFKYLLLNGYDFDEETLKSIKLTNLNDSEIMDYYFERFNIYSNLSEEFREQFKKLLNSFLNTDVTVKNLKSIIETTAELEWLYYRKNNQEEYQNIFGKICGHLQNDPNIEDLEDDLEFLENMRHTLEDKYTILYEAMVEYANIYNSNIPKKLEKIQKSKNIISKLSALYIAKSKEDYKKDIIDNCLDLLSSYYKIREDHPLIRKKIIELKQNKKFANLYKNMDEEIHLALDDIEKRYCDQIPKYITEQMVDTFCKYRTAKTTDVPIIEEPDKYEDYVKYLKTIKLINRLNNGYIDINGVEVSKYKNLIMYDRTEEQYAYCGPLFTSDEIEEIQTFIKYDQIFNKIKRDITYLIRTIKVDDNGNQSILGDLADTLPFTDEYFIFDLDYNSDRFDFSTLVTEFINKPRIINTESYTNQESYEVVFNLLVKYGLIWLLLIQTEHFYLKPGIKEIRNNGVNSKNIFEIINNMPKIVSLSNEFKIDLDNYDEIININEICTYAKDYQIAILGKDIIKKIKQNQDYTDKDIETKLDMATELICAMTKRNKSTVPYVHGETLNYKYSIYDQQDETILLAGINTDSCFRIDGVDNDFLHYCALDKNGFVIKITDYFGNFIARASGFRNGNCIYLNQLRTIYDEGGNNYHGEYETETNEIIAALKQASKEIVLTSHNNPFELNKIDFVFVTQSYCLEDYESNVSDAVEEKIGSYPMDRKSADWKNFISTTKNLDEARSNNNIDTDYGSYELICLYSTLGKREIKPKHIKPKNVEAVYERPRNEIIVTASVTKEIYQKVNKIKAIKSYFEEIKFTNVDIPSNSLVCLGDNWFIIYKNGNIIDSCYLVHDEKAKLEFDSAIKAINNAKTDTSIKNIKIEPIINHNTSNKTKSNILRRILKRN